MGCMVLLLTFILLKWRIWWASNNASRRQMGFSSVFKGLMFWLFSIFWHPSIHVGHWLTQGLSFVMSYYWWFTCLPSGSRSRLHTHWIVFQHICLLVMILFHDLSCFLRAWNSSVFMAIIQYKPTKCTFPKLIIHKLYQLTRPQYTTHFYVLTYLLTYLLHGTESFLRS